ncbi:O-antigen export protein [Lentimicrobium sp.]
MSLLNKGHKRSVRARKNIIASFAIKGVSIVIGFIFVPLLYNHLGAMEYGIWITLTSIIAWVIYFDIGLGNGLRNRFAESLAKNEHQKAKIYVSTTYAGFGLIFGGVFLLFLIVSPFLDWEVILKAPPGLAHQLSYLTIFVFGFFLLRFILQLINVILMADQRNALSNIFDPASNLLALILTVIIIVFATPTLFNLAIVISIAPVILLGIASIYLFRNDYKQYRPDFKTINFKYFKDLANLGLRFFIIQITVVIIMSTNSIIITQVVGPEAVSEYQIANKYFGMAMMLFVIISNIYWSAYTEAYVKKEFAWIKKVNRNLIRIWGAVLVGLVILLIFADSFYRLWIGKDVNIPFELSLMMAIFNGVYIWYIIFIYFINATGKIMLQLYISVIVATINIPLSIFLAGPMGLGAAGVVLGSALTYLPGAIIAPIQYYKIVNQKDEGIWAK